MKPPNKEPTAPKEFPHNPAHPIGTCAKCGGEMVHNVPRIGTDGGFVHKETGRTECDQPTAPLAPPPSTPETIAAIRSDLQRQIKEDCGFPPSAPTESNFGIPPYAPPNGQRVIGTTLRQFCDASLEAETNKNTESP